MDNESKLYVKKMLLSGDAVVTQFKGGGSSGTVSDVWKRFGRIAMRDSGDLVQGVVACGLCFKVYSYKNSSQGTSTLRLHVCEYDDAPPQQRKGSRKNSTAAGLQLHSEMSQPVRMGRVRRNYSRQDMEDAVRAVRERRMNLNSAANFFCIPKSSLHYALSGKTKLDLSGRPAFVITKGQENELVRVLASMAYEGVLLNFNNIEEMVQRRMGAHKNPFANGRPGRSWWIEFRNRHPEIQFVFAAFAPKDTPGTSEASWPAVNSAQVVQRLKTGETLNAPHSMTQREMKPILPKPSTASSSTMMPSFLEAQLSPQPRTAPTKQKPAQQRPKPSPLRVEADSEPQQVCLRWNSFHSNMETMFPALLNKEKFVDVTLACEGRVVKCHKVVLSSCSPYLEQLLSDNPCKHPIIVMPRDVPYWALRAIVEFMYCGEVSVEHEQLAPLLAAAEALQIKGLAGETGKQPSQKQNSDSKAAAKRKRTESPAVSQQKQQPAQQPQAPQQSTSTHTLVAKKEKDSAHPPPAKRPQMAPQLAESLRSLSPAIEITPLVTFEEIKTEPVDSDGDDSNDDGPLGSNQNYAMDKGYDDGESSLPASHVESLIEEEDIGDDGTLNDHSPHDPSDLLSTEMDPMDDGCSESVNVYSENGMDFGECGLEEAADLVEPYLHDDPGEEHGS